MLDYLSAALAWVGLASMVLGVVVRLTPWDWDDRALGGVMRWAALLAPAVASVRRTQVGSARQLALVKVADQVLSDIGREREQLHQALHESIEDTRSWLNDHHQRVSQDASQQLQSALRMELERAIDQARDRLEQLVEQSSRRIEQAVAPGAKAAQTAEGKRGA